jgi:hypothetical protein
MKIFEKLKTVKKKWLVLTSVLVLIVAIGGVCGTVMHMRYGFNYMHNDKGNLQTYYNLLYLENTDTLKLTKDQAKALLPLAEKLSTADKTTQADILKNIYNQLSPEQYSVLINGRANNAVAYNAVGKSPEIQNGKGFTEGRMNGNMNGSRNGDTKNPNMSPQNMGSNRIGPGNMGFRNMCHDSSIADTTIKDYVINMLKNKSAK